MLLAWAEKNIPLKFATVSHAVDLGLLALMEKYDPDAYAKYMKETHTSSR
jgi:hypothetical protein